VTNPGNRIYLASRSPRRRELLKQVGVVFDLPLLCESLSRGADVDETPRPNEGAADYVTRIARAKAEAGWRHIMQRRVRAQPVLAADTTVVLDGEILGKPADGQDAQRMLRRLSGRAHHVLTAVAVGYKERVESALSTSTVEFRQLEDEEIRRYVASGEPMDKAGSYAIQGRAASFVRTMSGSYSGVMGLPLFETAQLLRRYEIAMP
jgi:septum formation protein